MSQVNMHFEEHEFKSVKIPDDNQVEMKPIEQVNIGHEQRTLWKSLVHNSHFFIIDGHAFYPSSQVNPFTGEG